MPKSRLGRLFFALFVLGSLCIIGRNLYRRSLNAALIAAVKTKNVSSVRALLNRGADVTAHVPDETGKDTKQSVLSLALDNNRNIVEADEISLMLLRQSASRSEIAVHGEWYLSDACGSGKVAQVRLLLEAGVNPNSKSPYSSGTPVSRLVGYYLYGEHGEYGIGSSSTREAQAKRRNTTQEITRLLREHGAVFTLAQLAELGDIAEIKTRLEAGESPDSQEAHQDTALCVASKQGNQEMIRLMLAHGAAINREGALHTTPLEASAANAHLDAMNLLLALGANVNPNKSSAPLEAAARSKNAQEVRFLLAHGANPSLPHAAKDYLARDSSDSSWVLSAAIENTPDVVPDLLTHGANVNTANGGLLKTALLAHRPGIVRELLRRGARVRFTAPKSLPRLPPEPARPPDGRPALQPGAERAFLPLMTAVCHTSECVDMLLQANANVNETDIDAETPLTFALLYAPATVETLLKHGAKVNIVTHAQRTPLDMAAAMGNVNCVRLLLAHGADINSRPHRGHTPLYYARRKNHADIILLLKQRGAVEE